VSVTSLLSPVCIFFKDVVIVDCTVRKCIRAEDSHPLPHGQWEQFLDKVKFGEDK
jgi:hypothetical protein